MSRPDTKYVAIGDADVAYQVLGEGPSDLLFFNGLGSNVEMAWEDPDIADFLRRLASLRRLILLDRRGTGASDGVPRNAIPTWEEWTEDIESVLNAVGSEQTSILATVDAGPIAILYAAAHPERVDSLVLCNTTARYLIADDYPIGFTPEATRFRCRVPPDPLGYAGVPLACWFGWPGRPSSPRCPCSALPVVGHPENRGGTVRLPASQSRCSPGAPAPPGAHAGPERRQSKLSSHCSRALCGRAH